MRFGHFILISALMMTTACATTGESRVPVSANEASEMKTANEKTMPVISEAPANRPGDDFDELWGEKVPDPYRWLEDASNPEVAAWSQAQDVRARAFLEQLPGRDAYKQRLTEVVYTEDFSTPWVNGNRMFYMKKSVHDEKSILYMRDMASGEETVLIDPNQLSEDGSIAFGGAKFSKDGKRMAYRLKVNNSDQATVHVRDLDTGKDLPDVIENGRYAYPIWSADGSGFYYVHFPTDASIPVDRRPGMTDVRYHKLGTDVASDEVIVPPMNDATKFHRTQLSDDRKWFIYGVSDGWNGNTVRLRRVDGEGDGAWIDMKVKPKTSYHAEIFDDVLFMLTNDGAPTYRMVRIALTGETPDLSENAWKEIVASSPERVIVDFTVIGDKLFVVSQQDAVSIMDVYTVEGQWLKRIDFPDKGTIGTLSGEGDDEALYFKFTSYRLPRSVYKIDPKTLEMSMFHEIKTPIQTEDFISEQHFAVSKDGTKVPMFILRHKDTPLDGSAKTIIYGYGGFNVSVTPSFNPYVYPWLERGGIYVYTNLRGGSEYGEQWHRDGMKLKKQNVFDDYYAAAEYLIEHKYTRQSSLAAYGGSNGGLLTGAALTQRPDLYGAVVCAVPLLDMVRYQMFGSGRTWIGEYGSVENSREEFDAIRAYSPYSNVKQTDYPAVLFLGADSDDRVDPMHARKMTAIVQDRTTSEAPVLLRIEKNAGHGGADMRSQAIEKTADIYSFLDMVLK